MNRMVFEKVLIELKAGANEVRFETRAGSAGKWNAAFALADKCSTKKFVSVRRLGDVP